MYAAKYANESKGLVTIGITPTRPETGYGYIQINDKQVAENIEEWRNDYQYDAIKNEFTHKTAQPIENELVNNWFK